MWLNQQETLDLVTITEEILSGKLHVLCSVYETTTGIQVSERQSQFVSQLKRFIM